MAGNREYKSVVFAMLMEDKHYALQVYNCIAENVLKEFLIENRSEVEKVITLDYTFERRLELQREEGREEGKLDTLYELVKVKYTYRFGGRRKSGYDRSAFYEEYEVTL
jgi:hypothetical protein